MYRLPQATEQLLPLPGPHTQAVSTPDLRLPWVWVNSYALALGGGVGMVISSVWVAARMQGQGHGSDGVPRTGRAWRGGVVGT